MLDTTIYQNIAARTGGDIYLGVVGPVRTGKSTFIKRFMDLMVLSRMEEGDEKSRTVDELPQAAQGKTIMTTEPKFIPREAVEVKLEENLPVRIRLIDCVGYLIDGVNGHMEDGKERMVRTPWYDYEIPFAKAAMIGTQRVIREHSTIGIVVTTDGSFTDLPRAAYLPAEERTVAELKEIGKPFVILLNTPKPYSEQTAALAEELREKYQVSVLPVNCEQMRSGDLQKILQQVLYEFPVERLDFFLPKWVEMLPQDHPVRAAAAEEAERILYAAGQMRDIVGREWEPQREEITEIGTEQVDLAAGTARLRMQVRESLYYENLSELTGVPVHDEYEMISLFRSMAKQKQRYDQVGAAMDSVQTTGYGVVSPSAGDIRIEEPVLMRHGNRYGVKIRASSPSIHMIRANIETEIAPVIGSEEQAQDLIDYIKENQDDADGLWKTKIFGKSVGELVEDGIRRKITMMDEESQMKLQDTMQKIVNDSNGGLVCIII
ncbi:MAG: stage IV sporulation protein A [Lachnospiraceae bacterium]|nr:stage IV sporulation protein A [Lachnospiraceae bacterium]